MASQTGRGFDAKYKRILSHERTWAYALAAALRRQRPITVWEVLMPLFLVFNYARAGADRDFMAQNFLFTKEPALKAAFDILKRGRQRDAVRADIEAKTGRILAEDKGGLYSEAIRAAQLREIDLLTDHYLKLLAANGSDYASLVSAAYPAKEGYLHFLNALEAAERDVSDAALDTLGPRGDPGFAAAVQLHSVRLRIAEADTIYGTASI